MLFLVKEGFLWFVSKGERTSYGKGPVKVLPPAAVDAGVAY